MVDQISLPRIDFDNSERYHLQSTKLNYYNYCYPFLLSLLVSNSKLTKQKILQLVLDVNCDKTVFVLLFSLPRFTSFVSETRKKDQITQSTQRAFSPHEERHSKFLIFSTLHLYSFGSHKYRFFLRTPHSLLWNNESCFHHPRETAGDILRKRHTRVTHTVRTLLELCYN